MKKLLPLLLALAVLAGCAPAPAPAAEPTPSPSTAPAPVLAFFGTGDAPWQVPAREAAEAWCEARGWVWVCYDCAGLSDTQEVQVEDLLRSGGAAGAVLCPVGGEAAAAQALRRLRDGGVKTLLLDDRGRWDWDDDAAAGMIAPQRNTVFAAAAGYFRENSTLRRPSVILLHDAEEEPLEALAAGALEAAGVGVAEETYTWGSVDYARAFLTDALARHPGSGVLCFSRTGLLAAREVLGGERAALCLGATGELLRDLRRGEPGAVLTAEPAALAEGLEEALDRLADGGSVGRVDVPAVILTAEDLDDLQ